MVLGLMVIFFTEPSSVGFYEEDSWCFWKGWGFLVAFFLVDGGFEDSSFLLRNLEVKGISTSFLLWFEVSDEVLGKEVEFFGKD